MSKKKPLNELYSQDFLKYKSENDIEIINLDSVANFSELRTKMQQISCEGKVSGIRFKLNDTRYHIIGFSDCPTSGEIGCYFRRNFLSIKNDSLIIGYGKYKRKKPINYLKTELNNIMSFPHNFQYNEDKVKAALIHFYVEDKYPISITKTVLKEIAEQFSALNSKSSLDYFKYSILFESVDVSSIPPPPPNPNEFDIEK